MSKLRSLSTAFWSDPFIEDLTPVQKLLFIYLITNEKTNMLGIYESSIKKMSFETSIKKDDISNALEAFERVGKVKYLNNYVILTNYMKHQNYNTNMKKSAIDVYNNLPKELKDSSLSIDKSNPSEGFESLLNHFGMVRKVEVEVEDEIEVEDERETKTKITIESVNNVYSSYPSRCPIKSNATGKCEKNKDQIKKLLIDKSEETLIEIIELYVADCTKTKTFIKNFGTFLNNLPDIEEIKKVTKKKPYSL